MTSPAPDSGRGPRFNACLDALKRWRDSMVREGRVPLGALKEAHLKNAIVRGRRDERVVAALLPGTYSYLAHDIVAVILATDPVNPPPVAPPVTRQHPQSSAAQSAPQTPTAHPPPQRPPDPAHSAGPTNRTGRSPSPDPAAPAPAPAPTGLPQDGAAFAPLDFTEDLGEAGDLRAKHTASGVILAWDAAAVPAGEQVFYRLVATDQEPSYAPELADLVSVTTDLTAIDDREFAAAVRYYQVWRNSARRFEEAAARQPRWHASCAVVAPVQGLTLREDAGRVIGQWAVYPEVTRVHVYRIPLERAAQAGMDSQYRIAADDQNLSGFIDREATRGKNYLYRFFTEATIDGVARLSSPVGQTVSVSALLSPVDDLRVRSHGTTDDWLFDLEWTNPVAGRVVVYRTQSPPMAGLGQETRDESALPMAGLPLEDRLAHPVLPGRSPGTTGMREVPSPIGWDRVYLTPVTLINGRARVGRSVSQVIIPLPQDAIVVERTYQQVLKFGWPGNAAAVAVGIGARGAAAAVPQEGPGYLEVSREAYQRQGGLQFPYRLISRGCSIHLAGISFVNRERMYGEPVVVDYPGLLQLAYTTEFKRSMVLATDRVLIRVSAERDLSNCPPFVLVHNPDRLPLSVGDGERLTTVLNAADEVAAPSEQFRPARLTPQFSDEAYRASVRGRGGYIRLFVDVDPEMLRQVALLDPPVANLMIPR